MSFCSLALLFCPEAYIPLFNSSQELSLVNINQELISKHAKHYLCNSDEHFATTSAVGFDSKNFATEIINVDEDKVNKDFKEHFKELNTIFHVSCVCKRKDFCDPSDHQILNLATLIIQEN